MYEQKLWDKFNKAMMEDINVVVKDECQKLSQKLHFFIS